MEIPGYRIRRTLGRGGMATVYLATQESLGRDVVLKVREAGAWESEAQFRRFVNEGRIIAGLRHPNIVSIHDIATIGRIAYLAMEYVDGGDLASRMGEPIPPADALHVLERIGSALGHAHQHGVVHRDVKPENILFRADGTPLLTDFGIAKQMASDSGLTTTGRVLGSPFYLSPEQAEGQFVDGRSDLYSLGVMFYEMLTGERPYTGTSPIRVALQHIESPPPTLPPELSRYQGFLDRLMAKNRDVRIPDAATLLRQIEMLRAPRRRRWPRAALIASTAATLLAAAGLAAWLHARPALSAGPSSPTPDTAQAGTPSGQAASGTAGTLASLARASLREGRLAGPPGDNAYYYYSRVLALEPDNREALRGLGEIAHRFAELAEDEMAHGDLDRARAYIMLGLQIEPDSERLVRLQSSATE